MEEPYPTTVTQEPVIESAPADQTSEEDSDPLESSPNLQASTPVQTPPEAIPPRVSIEKERVPSSPSPSDAPKESLTRGTSSSFDRFFRVTKTRLYEKFGKAKATVDPELQEKLEELKRTKERYDELLSLGRKYEEQFDALMDTSRSLSRVFSEFAVKVPDEGGRPLMAKLGRTHRVAFKQGVAFRPAQERFYANIDTFRSKAIEDTLDSVGKYEKARLEYDAFQLKCSELEEAEKKTAVKNPQRVNAAKKEAAEYKATYLQLRAVVDTKIDMLNKMMTLDMQSHVESYLKSMAGYFLSNSDDMEKIMRGEETEHERQKREKQ